MQTGFCPAAVTARKLLWRRRAGGRAGTAVERTTTRDDEEIVWLGAARERPGSGAAGRGSVRSGLSRAGVTADRGGWGLGRGAGTEESMIAIATSHSGGGSAITRWVRSITRQHLTARIDRS